MVCTDCIYCATRETKDFVAWKKQVWSWEAQNIADTHPGELEALLCCLCVLQL